MTQNDLFPPDLVLDAIERVAAQWRADTKALVEHARRSFGQTTRFDHFERRFARNAVHTTQEAKP